MMTMTNGTVTSRSLMGTPTSGWAKVPGDRDADRRGGTLSGPALIAGVNAGGHGIVNVSGGQVNFAYSQLGANGLATVNVSGGELNLFPGNQFMGLGANSRSALTCSGGKVQMQVCLLAVGAGSLGTIDITGGTVVMSPGA